MKTNHKQINNGFTLIETLVAITILMIAVAGPLVVANKSLNAALYARDQTMASYLAQELMEELRNTKDNNLAKDENKWLHGVSGVESGKECVRKVKRNGQEIGNSLDRKCRVSTELTSFTRYYYVNEIEKQVDKAIEAQVVVIVEWENGSVQNSMTLTSEFTRTLF